jgi:autotransporter-associated beta strand protein
MHSVFLLQTFLLTRSHCLTYGSRTQRQHLVHSFRTCAALSLLLAFGPAAFADTTWTSTSNGVYSTAANWNNGLPSTGPQLGIFQDSASIQHVLDITATGRNAVGLRFDLFSGGSGFVFSAPTTTFTSAGGFQLRTVASGATLLNNDDNAQTFNVPMAMFSSSGVTGPTAAQTWSAAAGDLIISGIYLGTRFTVNNNGGMLTIDGAFNTTIGSPTGRGDMIGAGGLTKNGNGTLTLGGTVSNSYSGGTIINSGSVIANKSGAFGTGALTLNGGNLDIGANPQIVGAVTNAGGTMYGSALLTGTSYRMLDGTVNLGLGGAGVSLTKSGPGTVTLNGVNTYTGPTRIEAGILRLGGNNRVSSSSDLQLAGGVLGTGGYSQMLGTLDLDLASTIDFGSGASALAFADSDLMDWNGSILTIANWTEGVDTLRVGLDGTGFDTQLGLIRFADFGDAAGQIDANGFITPVPVPEPSTFVFQVLGGLAAICIRRRS